MAHQKHIPALLRLKKQVILQAVCDRNECLAKETTARYSIPSAYTELSEMLLKEDLDIIHICTPPQVHTPLAVEALQHGCHVLMEKPMALKTSECDQMIEAARKHGAKLCVVHNVLFDPPFIKAKKLVAEGAIGDFVGMRIYMSDARDAIIMRREDWMHKLPGGVIGETGPHAAYMSLAFLKKVRAADIYAKNFLEHPWAPFDEFRIELEGEKAMSSILISYTSNHGNLYVDLLGTEGFLVLDVSSLLLIRQGKRGPTRPIPFARYFLGTSSQAVTGVAANAFKVMTGKLKLGHQVVIEEFVDSVLKDGQPPVTGEEGREVVRVMEMVVDRLHQKYGG
ncbi:Gfo/Idh/MocA family protein [Chloroflexota bacterium]